MSFPAPGVYAVALLLTLAVETPLYAAGLAATGAMGGTAGGRTGFGVNLVSHPLAFLVAYPLLVPALGTLPTLVAVEVGVVYLEAALTWRRGPAAPTALLVSAVANVTSLAIGFAILH